MDPLAARTLRTIRRRGLLDRGARVVAAVSGGSDSVALAYLLRELHEAGELALVSMAHFHHGLRGEAADEDERFCRELAERLSAPIDVERADVRALARETRASIEEAARAARYAFFERAATRARADRVAVGHTRDDQAETFLLRLFRGAGPRGLAGILPRVRAIVRPLLDTSRAELREYLGARGIAFREDETNRDTAIPRNRIRLEVLPYLRERVSPAVGDVLAREAEVAREDAEYLDDAARVAADTIVERRAAARAIDRAALLARPAAIARRIVRLAMAELAPGRFVGFAHVQAVLDLAAGAVPAGVDLPGQRAELIAGNVVLSSKGPGRAGSPPSPGFHYELPVPGEIWVSEGACAISAEKISRGAPERLLAGRGDLAVVRAAGLGDTLGVRGRRPGDAFRPLGLGGRKKLQDFFVDRKVPRTERDRVPLVVDARDRIVWVAGHAVAEDFRVTDGMEPVIILRLKQSGGTA